MTYFTIDPAVGHVKLAKDRSASLVFTVANKSGVARELRAIVETDAPIEKEWLRVQQPSTRMARVEETVQFHVDVDVSPEVPAGTYRMWLRVVATDNPDDVFAASQSIPVEVPEGNPTFPWWVLALGAAGVIVLVLLVWWLWPDDGDLIAGDTTTTTESAMTTAEPSTTTTELATTTTQSTTTTQPTTTTTEPTTTSTVDPRSPDLFFAGSDVECDTIINGSITGADVLNMYVMLRNQGVDEPDRLVPIELESDSGLVGSANHAIGEGSSVNALQLDLDSSDYQQTHLVTAVIDPDNEIIEIDETNNTMVIAVQLGTRATGTHPCQRL